MSIFNASRFRCVYCGKEGLPIQRKKGQDRGGGHLKKLYCLTCGCETNHAELREFDEYTDDIFEVELKNNNFNNQGNRKIGWKQFLHELQEEIKC